MNYYNLEKYAEKININRLSRQDQFYGYSGARFELIPYGSGYFFNTSIHVDALRFCFEYSAGASNYAELTKQAQKIKKYAARYGFAVCYEGHNLTGFYFSVIPADEKKQLDIYNFFVDQSVNECETLIHSYHVNGIYKTLYKQLDTELRSIMTRYEKLYLEYIEKYNKENNFYKLHFVA